jgi:hypothetical protein
VLSILKLCINAIVFLVFLETIFSYSLIKLDTPLSGSFSHEDVNEENSPPSTQGRRWGSIPHRRSPWGPVKLNNYLIKRDHSLYKCVYFDVHIMIFTSNNVYK